MLDPLLPPMCSSYRLTSVYVYELSYGLAAATEMVLDRLMMVLVELPVLTDFGVCLLVELACAFEVWVYQMIAWRLRLLACV